MGEITGPGADRRALHRARMERWATALLVGGSVALALACSRHGAGIGGDGVGYVIASRNLLGGNGLSWVGAAGDVRPMTIFGPLFPVLLSALGLIGVEALAAARGLNAVLFGLNVFLVLAVLRENGRVAWIPWLGGLLFAFFPPLIGLHAGVQSEPIFLTLLLLEILALTRALRTGSRGWLWAAAAASGLAYLARYAGLAFVASGILAVLTQPNGGWRRRVGRAASFASVAGVPVAAWMARNALAGASATARLVDFEPPTTSLAVLAADLVSYWFLPDRLPIVSRALAVALGGMLLAAAWLWTRRKVAGSPLQADGPSAAGTLRRVLAWGVAVYAAQILVSRAFLVPRISLDQRILVPAWLLTILFLLTMGDDLFSRAGPRLAALIAATMFLLTVSYLVRGTIRAIELQVDGQGFASRAWQTSPLINAMSQLPPDTPIYTNEVEALYLLAGRRVYRLPTGCLPLDALVVVEPETECRTPEYQTWVENMRRALEGDRAVLAVFNTYRYIPYYAPLVPELIEGLDVLTTQGDGWLYVYDREAWPENPNW